MFSLQYLYERLHGLDFTMRDLSSLKGSGGVLHGYSKTYEKHFSAIMETLDIRQESSFLDVGCGKGSVLRQAAKYPFKCIAGIDFDGRLINIAERNFKKLKMSERVQCIHADARAYAGYGDFDYFYFFNPFDGNLMEDVIGKIIEQSHKDFTIIYHNPVYYEMIESMGCFIRVGELYDGMKDYYTYVYRYVKK